MIILQKHCGVKASLESGACSLGFGQLLVRRRQLADDVSVDEFHLDGGVLVLLVDVVRGRSVAVDGRPGRVADGRRVARPVRTSCR